MAEVATGLVAAGAAGAVATAGAAGAVVAAAVVAAAAAGLEGAAVGAGAVLPQAATLHARIVTPRIVMVAKGFLILPVSLSSFDLEWGCWKCEANTAYD